MSSRVRQLDGGRCRLRTGPLSVASYLTGMAFALAVAASTALSEEAEERARALFHKAAALQNAGEYQKAAGHWEELLAAKPEGPLSAEAQGHLGACLVELGRLDEAVTILRAALARSEHDDRVRWNLGVAHYQRAERSSDVADRREAARHFDSVLERDGLPQERRGAAAFFGARSHEALGSVAQAAGLYHKIVAGQWGPRYVPESRFSLARIADRAGRWDDAVPAYRDFLAKHPSHALAGGARRRLADVLLAAGRLADADTAFSELAGPDGSLADEALLETWAQVAVRRDNIDEAARRFAILIERFGTGERSDEYRRRRGEILLVLARRHKDQGQTEHSIETYRKLLAGPIRGADRPSYLLEAVVAALGVGKEAVAADWVLDLAKTAPASSEAAAARVQMARYLAAREDFRKALTHAEAAIESKESRASALFLAGHCSAKLEQFAQAEPHFRMLLAESPRFELRAEALFWHASVLESLDRRDQAIQEYRRLVEESPDHALAQSARDRLKRIAPQPTPQP